MDNPTPLTEADVSDAALAVATAQAAKDAELLAALKKRPKKAKQEHMTVVLDDPVTEPLVQPRMNRAQRRERVAQYAKLLAFTERQEPVVNPTIIPKSKRRRQKRNK